MEAPGGLELARLFYVEVLAPLIDDVLPGRPYSAGLIGPCSDVIGFDDAVSRDHGWGPRGHVLLAPAGFEEAGAALDAALTERLPCTFRGYSTSFAKPHAVPVRIDRPPVAHWVDITTPGQFLQAQLGVSDPERLTAVDWLTMHEHRLLSVTAGALFRDDLGFEATRRQLAHYPDDIRLHLIAAEWQKIAQEQAFPGRAGSRGDEVGSAIIAARLAESLVRLCFYVQRVYPPYSKWLGSAFLRLPGCAELSPQIAALLAAPDWQTRDMRWSEGLRGVIALHERAGLLAPGKYHVAPVYLGRPGSGLPAFERGGPPSIEQLIEDIRAGITAPDVRALPPALGSINQLSACCDLTDELVRRSALAGLYRPT
jgi:Domain of unknown function (DUF4037)